jgi:hypothetical protein
LLINYRCRCGAVFERFFHHSRHIQPSHPCIACGLPASRDLIATFSVYGTDKFHDQGFADASEASGKRITNTKQVDRLERSGFMQAVTCPSQHRKRRRT